MEPNEGFFRTSDYLALPRDPQPWIVKGLVPIGGLVNLYGQPKTGKSFAAIGLAHAVATGAPFWLDPKFEVVKKGPVAFLQLDTPRGAWAARLAVLEASGLDLENVYFNDKLTAPYPFNILIPDHFNWLKKSIANINPILTFVDTIREAHGGDENDSTVMKNVVSQLVAATQPSALTLVSHSRKENKMNGDDLMNDARGSSYMSGRMDTVLKLTPKFFMYRGRALEDGKLKVKQDPITRLIIPDDGDGDDLAAVILLMLKEHPDESVNALAKRVHAMVGDKASVTTISRRIKAIREGEK